MLMRADTADRSARLGLRAAQAAAAIAAAAFAAALISQYVFGLQPCELCVWQRYPYGIGLALAVPALAAPALPRRLLFALAGLAFLVGAGIAVFHSGVEFGWWKGFESCSAPTPGDVSATAFLEQLKTTEITRCDDRQEFLFGLSMANWNIATSIGVAALFLVAATSLRRATR